MGLSLKNKHPRDPGTTRFGKLPKIQEVDARTSSSSDESGDAAERRNARPGPARRITAAYKENKKQGGKLNAQGLEQGL